MNGLLSLQLLLMGAAAGGFGAALGVGGGVILVPALVLLAQLPFTQAVGTSLVCVVATSVAASAVQFARGRIEVRAAVQLQLFASAGAVVGGLLAPSVPATLLYFAFAGLLVITAERTWPRGAGTAAPPAAAPTRPAVASAGAVGGGVVSTLLGVGGGLVFTPLLHLVLGHDFHRAAATSVYIIGITAGSGALVYLARGDVALAAATPTMLGVLVGAGLAASASHRLDARWLKRGFALLLLYVSVRMVLQGLGNG